MINGKNIFGWQSRAESAGRTKRRRLFKRRQQPIRSRCSQLELLDLLNACAGDDHQRRPRAVLGHERCRPARSRTVAGSHAAGCVRSCPSSRRRSRARRAARAATTQEAPGGACRDHFAQTQASRHDLGVDVGDLPAERSPSERWARGADKEDRAAGHPPEVTSH
jgi:hypothetical protein